MKTDGLFDKPGSAGVATCSVDTVFRRENPLTPDLPNEFPTRMIEHLRRCLPCEGVGLLGAPISRHDAGGDRFYPGRNTDGSPERYTMDPVDVLAALWDMVYRTTRLGAVVHSYPRTPPIPSAAELAETHLRGVLSVIVGFTPDKHERAWEFAFDRAMRVVGTDGLPIAVLDRW